MITSEYLIGFFENAAKAAQPKRIKGMYNLPKKGASLPTTGRRSKKVAAPLSREYAYRIVRKNDFSKLEAIRVRFNIRPLSKDEAVRRNNVWAEYMSTNPDLRMATKRIKSLDEFSSNINAL